jgi:hypothetical protein
MAMTEHERRFIDAADELYSAVAEAISLDIAMPTRVRDTMRELANASNAWLAHPAKLEEAARRAKHA